MSYEKEVSEEDKVTQTNEVIQEVEGSEITNEKMPEPEAVEHEHEEEVAESVDYSNFSKNQLLTSLKQLLESGKYLKVDGQVNEIKSHFDEIFHKEKESALEEFTKNGGSTDDFEYRPSEEDRSLFAAFNEFRERKTEFLKEQEKNKEKNLIAKNAILDRLRELVDGEETTHSINTIKHIQDDWKKIGPVPAAQNRNLWASFNALMDRFYDNRSIYFELKELDRKKNLEQKMDICEKAEALVALTDLKDAIKILNELHEEFKHIGPVPRDEQETLWNRFKAASDAVYSRRKEFYDGQKESLKENLQKKEVLIKKLEADADYKGSKIKDWNSKTKEILGLQKEELIKKIKEEAGSGSTKESSLEEYIAKFNSLGFVPRKNMKEIVHKFNEAVDEYVKNLGFAGGAKDDFLFRLNLNKLQSDPNSNRVLNKKEHGIRKQIADLENNVTLWRNNIEFFASSKTADKLKNQFDEKIQKAESEIDKLKKKLTILKEF